MPEPRKRRIRDPVHGLIVFEKDDPLDQLAWELLNQWPFQRLRRIKQLGLSDFVFPGATHTRLSHCIGVFHTARLLVKLIHRERPDSRDDARAEVAVLAALLHDIGHGPFSHVFEGVEKSRGAGRAHEMWTADIILDSELPMFALLESRRTGLARDVAELLRAENPLDVYHAVVSSSLDADRLDYLRRDRLMTGTGAGAIDFDWILDNLTVADIDVGLDAPEAAEALVPRPSFCLRDKALQAAESFLLARYHLYSQVYFHKATRGLELVLAALLRAVVAHIANGDLGATGLADDDALTLYYRKKNPSVADYMTLDDAVLWTAIGHMQSAKDAYISNLARRLWRRELFKAIDVTAFGGTAEAQRRTSRRIEAKAGNLLGTEVLKDTPKLGIYGEIGADEEKVHKRLMILMPDDSLREITEISDVIRAIGQPRLLRYYFADEGMRTDIDKWLEENHG